MPKWITAMEAARILGITPSGVYMAILRGKLKSKKPGRDYSIDANSVENYRVSRRRMNGRQNGI